MAAVSAPERRALRPRGPGACGGAEGAGRVRAYAEVEAAPRRRGAVVAGGAIRRRTALYELVARHLENPQCSGANPEVLADLQSLITEKPAACDTGATAAARDRRVAAILVSLERDGSLDGDAA